MSYELVTSMSVNVKKFTVSLSSYSSNVYPKTSERTVQKYTKDNFKPQLWAWINSMIGGTIQFTSANNYKWSYRIEKVVEYIQSTKEYQEYTPKVEEFKLWNFIDKVSDNVRDKAIDIFINGDSSEPKNAKAKEWYAIFDDNYAVMSASRYGNKRAQLYAFVKPYNFYKANYFARGQFNGNEIKVVNKNDLNKVDNHR